MSTSVEFQDILDMFKWTIADVPAVNMEKIIDRAIRWISLISGVTISTMTGTAGSKTVTLTDYERPIVEALTALYSIAYITGGSAVGINISMGEFKREKVRDLPIKLMTEQVEEGILALKRTDHIPLRATTVSIDDDT